MNSKRGFRAKHVLLRLMGMKRWEGEKMEGGSGVDCFAVVGL